MDPRARLLPAAAPRWLALLAGLVLLAAPLAVTGSATAGDLPAHHGGWGMMRRISTTAVARCSDGFNAVASDGHPVMITAGHCGPKGSTWISEVDGHKLGWTSRRNVTTDARANDWAIVRSAGNHAFGPTIVDRGVRKSVDWLGKPRVGDPVCMTGRTSGTICGKVTRVRDNGIIRTTIVPHTGDSGGPLFRRIPDSDRVVALGILSFSDQESYSGFQRLSEVLTKTGVRLRTV